MHNFWQKAYNEFTGKAVRRLSASGEQIRTPSEKAFRSYTISTLLMLIAPAVMAFYYYRWRVLLLLAVSISIAALCDAAGAALMRRKPGMDPLYAALTGAMIALLLPASAPLWLPAAGSAALWERRKDAVCPRRGWYRLFVRLLAGARFYLSGDR